MSRAMKALGLFFHVCGVFAVMILCGCVSTVGVTVKKPGEFKLGGVSKLALVQFNTMQDDGAVGVYSADAETVALTQSLVAGAFESGNTYKVTDLTKENAIADAEGSERGALQSTLANRFDAIIYGRVWWQLTPERDGRQPVVYKLNEWQNMKYVKKDAITGKEEEVVKEVTIATEEELALQFYRYQGASLMLSLTVYRLDGQGQVTKLVETYSFANYIASLKNGKGGIPTSLEMKCKLATQLTGTLAGRLSPMEERIEFEYNFNDTKLSGLLEEGAFLSGVEYAQYMWEKNVKDEYKKKSDGILSERAKVLDSSDLARAFATSSKEFKKAAEDNVKYIIAEALCQLGMGKYDEALYTFRLAFAAKPGEVSAQGIAKCLYAMDMEKRVKEVNKEVKKAEKKTNLQ